MLDDYAKMAIVDILESSNTLEKIFKFNVYGKKIDNCKIFLFDEEQSCFDESFKDYQLDIFGIYGIGDYTKTWVLDSKHKNAIEEIQAGKTIDFDLNILTYLNRLFNGYKTNINVTAFVEYLNYIKKGGYQIGITSAMLERASKKLDLEILSEMILSYIKFENMKDISDNINDLYIPEEDYMRAKLMYDLTTEQSKENIFQLDIIACCVMKAFLLREYCDKLSNDEKIEKFIEFCLNTLNCNLEKEIVILALYIMKDIRTNKFFQKIKSNKNIISNAYNIAWDILHIRLIENMMLIDNTKNQQVILSYFATADKGLIDIMKINPIKAFVIYEGIHIPYHEIKVKDVCKNTELLEEVSKNAQTRLVNLKTMNIHNIKQELINEIKNLQLL